MKIHSLEIKEHKLLLAAAGLIVVMVLIIYSILYAPLLKKLTKKHLECASYENDLARIHSRIESVCLIYDEKILMTEKNASVAIDELTRHGKSIGINFASIKPLEIITDKDGKYKILPVDMQIEADDEQFISFLGSLDELKKTFIKVKCFDIVPDKEDRKRLTARLTLDIYLSAREYA